MTDTRRDAMRRFLRDMDRIDGVTDRQKDLAIAVYKVPRGTTSIASRLDPWSPPVMQTLRQFVDDCRFTADLDVALRHHPGPKSDIMSAALVLSWMVANWKQRTFQRMDVGVVFGHLPQDIAEEYGLVDSGDRWVTPVYNAIQGQQKRLETKIRNGAVPMGYIEDAMIEASLRGADLDAIESVSCDTVAFEDWHLTQCYDRQDDVNKKVREHYREICGRKLLLAEMDMSAPELIAAARDLGITLGEDGRLQRNKHNTDSRSGRKSGTNKRPARDYIGFESTKIVATRTHTHDAKTGTVTLGPAVSPYVLASLLASANTNVGPISAYLMPRALRRATNVKHVLADGGITQKKDSFNTTVIELELLLHRTYDSDHVYGTGDIVNIVIGENKKKTHTVKVHCGELFHVETPKSWITPPPEYFALDEKPKDDETEDEREAREDRNEQRAKTRSEWLTERRRWKYDIHQRLDEGRLQFICPFHAGKLWCNEVPPSPKLRDGAKFVELPAGTTKCCNGTFIATRKDLVKIGHQEPVYFSPEHAEVYVHRIPVEGRFGTDQQKGAYEPRSCRAPLLEAHAIASLVFDAIGNLQLTMNKEIEELYELIDNYGTPTEPADTEPASAGPTDGGLADTEPADIEPADIEPADTEPADIEPADTEPASVGPTDTEPADTEPADTEPADTEPASVGPTDTEPADTEPADTEPADTEPASVGPTDGGPADKKQDNSTAPLTAVLGPRYETMIGNSPERDYRALAA